MFKKTITDADYRAHLDECLERDNAITRRGALTTMFGGLLLLSLGQACGVGDDDTAEGKDAISGDGYGPFLTEFRAAPDAMDPAKAPTEQRPWKALVVATWLKLNAYAMFAELREKCPILVTPNFPTIVTSYADTKRILHKNKLENGTFTSKPNTDFIVRHNSDTMEASGGKPAAMLGQVDVKLHDIDKDIQMRGLLVDATKVRGIVRTHVEKLLADHTNEPSGEIDIVSVLARRIPVEVAKDYFGVASGDGAFMEITDQKIVINDYDYDAKDYLALKPYDRVREIAMPHAEVFGAKVGDRIPVSEADIYSWIADVFQTWFLNLRDTNIEVRRRGVEAGRKLVAYLQVLVKKKLAAPPSSIPDDMLGRMVWLYLNDPEMKNKILGYYRDHVAPKGTITEEDFVVQRLASCVGSVGGAVVNIERFVTNIMEVLLRPKNAEHLKRATLTARAWQEKGDAAAADEMNVMRKYMLEAQRFRPQNDLLVRAVTTDQEFESKIPLLGGKKKVLIPASPDIDDNRRRTLVMAAIASANMDPSVFPRPDEIIITNDKSLRDEMAYLHMGGSFARHECLGKFLVAIEATECLRGLLLLGDLTIKEALTYDDEVYANDPLKARAYPHRFVLSYTKKP